ncbi:MAG: DUF3120 domain-containing protein [Leptolyngbyaceae cyanobacterium]
MSALAPITDRLESAGYLSFVRKRLQALPLTHRTFWAAVGLVAVPVFFQAPLVRALPWLSLVLTMMWLMAGLSLMSRFGSRLWGDLLVGFSWTWLAGSLYWGWFRWQPFVHIPVEAIGLPIVLVCLWRGWGRVGCYFYLGSLLGTAVTDLYVYWMQLLPFWRQAMQVDPEWVPIVLRQAVTVLQSTEAMSRALLLGLGLLTIGLLPLQSRQPCWWAFSGAVLSTLLVDGLFIGSAFLM